MPEGTSLSPVAFLERAARVFEDKVAVVDGSRRLTYGEFADRARRLAGLLAGLGVPPGEPIATLCANSHVMLEAHYGVPAASGVLVTLNTRLSEEEHLHQIRHAGVRCILATHEFGERARSLAAQTGAHLLLEGGAPGNDYDTMLAQAPPVSPVIESEHRLLSISYTSGTTGSAKGVMHTHRGTYLQTLAMIHHCALTADARYLWTLPMFHCHGWANTWAITAAGGTHVCLRAFSPAAAWGLIGEHEITHLSAAPTVLTMMLTEHGDGPALIRPVRVTTGGAPPSPALIGRMESAGLIPQHLYGLTETIGPSLVNVWRESWNALTPGQRARLHARQGVPTLTIAGMRVVDEKGDDVPLDGATRGEIELRGDTVTTGYFRNPEATDAAFRDGWFRTGDVAVVHEDGYVEVCDRLKDIIISGGENISSVEIERIIDAYPGVLESAVVGVPDPVWGERPVAFVDPGEASWRDDELTRHLRNHLAGFKTPKTIVRGALPKTATGKIRKDVLRRRATEIVGNGPAGEAAGSEP